jgi:hypothetical protein
MIDRDLYLPQGWIDDPARCRAAGVPDQVGFATKPALAQAMIARALDAGVPAAWVTGDAVDGARPGMRAELEARGISYVLAVACDHPVRIGGASRRVDALLNRVPARAWQCVLAGRGAKGHRYYDWAFIRLDPAPDGQAGQHWLLVRRHQRTRELAFYRCWMPTRSRWRSWSASPDNAGGSKSASRPARAWSAWTSTRSAAGAPGTGGPPWRCSPTPSW